MKSLVILFASSRSVHMFDKIFNDKSAYQMSLDWANQLNSLSESEVVVLADESIKAECNSVSNVSLCTKEIWTIQNFFSCAKELCDKKSIDTVIFSWADRPFINFEVTKTLLDEHLKNKAEYTFADGYPEGLCPEILDAGIVKILSELSLTTQKTFSESLFKRSSVFDLIQTDINSFEIETFISDEDYRLFRFAFDCGTKQRTLACLNLFEREIEGKTIEEISSIASKNEKILKTVPSFYNVSITNKVNVNSIYIPKEMVDNDNPSFMELKNFRELIKKISLFSESAVVSLSLWGEALLHPHFTDFVQSVLAEPGLSLLIETDGILVTEELCSKIKDIVDSANPRLDGGDNIEKIYWLVNIDATTKETYGVIHGQEDFFEKSILGCSLLSRFFPLSTYAQFTRMNENESELEAFYRFWSTKESPTSGLFTVQKYSKYCGVLPERKPADLSPLERNPCWHIRRDMNVLHDGTVCFCKEQLRNNTIGNAFNDSFEKIWNKLDNEVQNHMKNIYSTMCGKCDEYYTFNF